MLLQRDKEINCVTGTRSQNFKAEIIENSIDRMIDRVNGSEYKILDNIADMLGNNTTAKGTINILTEKATYASCLSIQTTIPKH